MPVSDDVLSRARRRDSRATETVLASVYPQVSRMAHALTGDAGTARRVTAVVLQSSLRVIPRWRDGYDPANWFYHHTLLTAREAAAGRIPDVRSDLLSTAGASEPRYTAFVRALRHLAPQQSEAFILHHGESLNPRYLGVAMDCSTQAALTHLSAATDSLKAVSGKDFNEMTAMLARAYAALTPPASSIAPAVRKPVAAARRARLVKAAARGLILMVVLAAAAVAAWHWRGPLLQWFTSVRGK